MWTLFKKALSEEKKIKFFLLELEFRIYKFFYNLKNWNLNILLFNFN